MDAPVFAVDFFDTFGYGRPLLTLSRDILFHGPIAALLMRAGFIRASRDDAIAALRAGAVTEARPRRAPPSLPGGGQPDSWPQPTTSCRQGAEGSAAHG